MRLELKEGFQKQVRELGTEQRAATFDVLLALPRAFGDPHRHAGLGIRRLHGSNIWEARIGLGLRLVFAVSANLLTPLHVLDHDGVKRLLRSL